MSARLDPLRLSNQLDERYRQYLQTRFQFKDPQLRRSFESRLRSSPLTKGPYLEATPLFKKAGGVESLFQDLLGKEVEPAFARAAGGERELYTHQSQALHSVHSGHNVIVATGTGSGKTEAFLLPILLHLYREHLEGRREPGVRALILYPMNALANDQRDRLGQICQRLQEEGSSFSFTFGQYTGDTPADLHDARRRASERERDRLAGELVFRSEMTETPPDILLTNYSMLEYLLLRPSDSPLFDGGRAKYWTFIVLDEAHQYRGAKGIEMGMLLRRLKRRLREGGREGPFRCIATSATLADDDPESRKAVAAFAAELFGESFQEQDVITGDVLPVPESSGKRLKPDCYAGLLAALDSTSAPDGRVIADAASEVGVTLPQGLPAEQSIARILERDQRSEELRRTVTGKPVLVRELAAQLFPELAADRQVEALGTLVTLLCSARNAPAGTPLLTARYHLFVRALEGAFLRFWPQRELLLERESQDTKNPTFEVALCHECGQHYLVVGKLPLRARAGIVSPPVVDPGHPDCGATYLMPLDEEQLPEDVDDDQDSGADRAEDSQNDVLHLCGRCGAYRKGAQPCDHSEGVVQVLRIANSERTDAPQKCASCGYTGGARDPVREVVHGADGPNAVIATTLFQELPEDRRKVLAFADGRQEAAFFAWYLEETCQDLLDRHILLKVLRAHSGGPASLATLHAWLCAEEGQSFRLRESDDQATIQRNAWRAILREFLTEERRLCLEGVGLVRWTVQWPESFQGAALLMSAPFSLSQPEALAVLEVLVNTMRLDLAVDIPSEIGVSWNDLGVSFTPKPYHGTNGNGGKFRIWTGSRAARADYLRRLAESNGGTCSPAHIEGCLIAIWHEMLDVANRLQDSRDGLLKQTGNGGYLLNPAWWRVSAVPPDTPLYRCDTCGRLQHVSVRGVCPRRGCPGKLGPVAAKDLEENHYRRLYKEGLPRRMRVEEHTAQIEHDEARRFQDDFKRGAINVLSCSTTFELGVDLGDLDAVFLRNVPPEGFNYTQRVGRAGRRPGYPGFAVTYCRRSSHDLYHFAEPERILAGSIRPPALEMTNHKVILRHIVAVVLSAFFRNHPDRFANVKALLGDMLAPRAADDIEAFARQMRQSLESSLAGIVPPAVWSSPDLANGEWIRRVAGGWKEVKTPGEVIHESRLRLAEAEANADYKAVHDLQVQAASEERQDYRT
ncbi:MAG: DEAD/DEAH box helicase, partial [Armatimonadota bacterium]